MSQKNRQRKIELLFVFAVFVFYLVWMLVQPFNATSDEHMRFQIADYIFQHGSLPHGGDPAIRDPIWGISYAFLPILSYIFGALFMKITSFFTMDPTVLLMSARLVSVLFLTATVFVCVKIANKLFKGGYKWMFLFLIAMLPEFAFMGSFVNNDAFALFSCALIIYAWIIGLESKWGLKSCLLLGIGIAACSLSYYNAYGFILCSILLFAASVLLPFTKEPGLRRWDFKKLFQRGLLITAVFAVLAGWWFIRNAILYDGDFIGMSATAHYQELYSNKELCPVSPQSQGISIPDMLIKNHWLGLSYRGLIGVFGYMDMPLSVVVYLLYTAVFFAGLCGLLVYIVQKLRRREPVWSAGNLFAACMAACTVIPVVLSIIYSYINDFQAQGRYLLPAVIPLMYFVTIGLRTLMEKIVKNQTIKRILQAAFCTGCFLMALHSLVFVLIPAYTN